MRQAFHHAVLRCLIGLCLGTVLHGQTTGGVRGTVRDATGAVVPHATVILINTATKVRF
jgi:hypothetical protein